jgi:hypothetical protein
MATAQRELIHAQNLDGCWAGIWRLTDRAGDYRRNYIFVGPCQRTELPAREGCRLWQSRRKATATNQSNEIIKRLPHPNSGRR